MIFSSQTPSENETLRSHIYAGSIFKLAPTQASLETVRYIKEKLVREIGLPLEKAHERLPENRLQDVMKALRLAIVEDTACLQLVRHMMSNSGFSPEENAFDYLRLRGVLHNGHMNPASERSYSLHRDTWYANPQCQINWWIPLHDATQEQTFSFLPEYFGRKISNSSGSFDYNEWMNKVGWQNTKGQSTFKYPEVQESPEAAEKQSFSCKEGEILLFSSAHLHQTNRNSSGFSRFSLDFRTVHLGDHLNGKGAPNADNGSKPDALQEYVFPVAA